MALPTAIASGSDADTPTAVAPLRVGLGTGVVATLFLLALDVVAPVPGRLLALLGGAEDGIARHGGLRMVWVAPQGTNEAALVRSFDGRAHGASMRRDGDAFVVELAGVAPEAVDEVARGMEPSDRERVGDEARGPDAVVR